MAFIPVIICGGSGARLWPLSRHSIPKPFAALPGRDNQSLMDLTYSRLASLPAITSVITVCAAEHAFLCRRAFDAAMPNAKHDIIGEPQRRNTAAAIAVATARAKMKFGDDATLLVLPADHLINNVGVFAEAAKRAMDAAKKGRIVLFGITPTYPASGYGYIQKGGMLDDGENVHAVRRFVEKPDAAKAAQMINDGGFLWNAGMFCFRADVLQNEMQQHAAEVWQRAESMGENLDGESYKQFPDISFDIALMEKTANAAVIETAQMEWSDLGTWRAVGDTLAADGNNNRTSGDVVVHDSKECIIIGNNKRLIAAAGVNNLHIIDGGDALLIADAKTSEQQTRQLFAALLKQQRPQATNAPMEMRPWGSYEVLLEDGGFKVKRINVLPGARLSLQSHKHRSEHWTTVRGTPTIVINEKTFDMPKDASCHIPQGAKHRIINNTEEEAVIIEVQLGAYLGEDDITRYQDDYNRK